MKPSTLIAVALVLGAIAAYSVSRWIGIGGDTASGPPVVIAAVAIDPGANITEEQTRVIPWPGGVVPPGSVQDRGAVVGRVVKQAIFAGEPIVEAKLASKDASGGLSSTITPGKRAISVRVNDIIAVAGFTLPGSYVDVMVNTSAGGAPFSRIVISRVKVLAIAQETASDQNKPKVVNAVTLELSPSESEQLDLARSIGSLSLVLRNELDKEAIRSSGSRVIDLVGQGPARKDSGTVGTQNSLGSGPKKVAGFDASEGVQKNAVQEIRGMQSSETNQ